MIEKIKKLRSTERGRVVFKFTLYMAFFVFMVLFITISSRTAPTRKYVNYNSTQSTEESKEVENKTTYSYLDKQKKLYSLDIEYEFDYKITGSVTVNYMGTYDNGIIEGFKETEDNLVSYIIEDGKPYSKSLKGKNEYPNLYKDVNEKYFDFEELFNLLNSESATIDNSGEDYKIYIYENIENVSYKIYANDESITKIEIVDEEVNYSLEFKY